MNEIRRLRHARREIVFVLVAIGVALGSQSQAVMFGSLCLNAFFWVLMLQEVGRDLDRHRVVVAKPPPRRARPSDP